jgi:hypothetical protein
MPADFRSVESTLNRYVEGLGDERSPDVDYARAQAKSLIAQYHRPENRAGFDNPAGKALAALVARVHGDTPVRARQLLTRLGLKSEALESAVEEFAHMERPSGPTDDSRPAQVSGRMAEVVVGRLGEQRNAADALDRALSRINPVLDVLDPVLKQSGRDKLARELARDMPHSGEVAIAEFALRRIGARSGEFLEPDVKLEQWEGRLMKKVRAVVEKQTPAAAGEGAALALSNAEAAGYF